MCHASPGEEQQLLCELSPSLGRGPELAQVATRVLVGRALDQEVGVVQDHRKQVVEVVRDATREPADALELLGLAQLVLKLAARVLAPDPERDVVEDAYDAHQAACRAFNGRGRQRDLALVAVRVDPRKLLARDPLELERDPHGVADDACAQ